MNNCPVWAGCGYGCGRQAASTCKQYVCFAFLRNLVLAAPKPAIYFFASPNTGGVKLLQLHRDQRGTISVLTVFAAIILTMLLGMVMNVGRHADGKVRMQNAADAAAYSGGAVLTRGMNTLAFTNHLLSDVFALTAFLREARDRNAEQFTPGILDAWEEIGPIFAGSSFPKFAALGQAITAKVPLERDLVAGYSDWGAAASERMLPLFEVILDGELIPQYQRAVVAVFPEIAQAAALEAARLHGQPDRGRGVMLACLWRTTGQPVGAAELFDPTLPVVDPVAYAAVNPQQYEDARDERNQLARQYLNAWNAQTMYIFDREGKMSQFAALWRSFTCGQLERLFDENAMRNLPHVIREDLTSVIRQNEAANYATVVDCNAHLERHFTFVAVTYWNKLPELLPGLFRNPAEADSQAYAAVEMFVPRSRLVWHYVQPGGQGDNPMGGMPGDFPEMPSIPGDDDGSGGGTGGGRWMVGRQSVPTPWDLWNQHWSVKLTPAVQPAIASILASAPPLADFAARGLRTPNLGSLTGDDLRQINTH